MNVATVIKQLPSPWLLAGQPVSEVEVRPPLLEDMMEAEKDAHPGAYPNAYRVALACRQIVRAGSYTGPFTVGQFKRLKPRQWAVIVEALEEADKLGEGEAPEKAQTT